ncbi:MAG TPA: flagellar hook-basal body protein [Gaiellaceae bacterium]
MPNGIYSAAAGMAAQQTRIDAIANDLANTSTTGYKHERVGFRDLVYNEEQGMPVGSGVASVSVGQSFQQGSLVDSDNPLALAIQGPGFFQVKRADGTTALTRAGDLGLDANGSLVTATGEELVPPIKVPKGTQPGDISIGADGAVTVAGKSVGKIQLVDVPTPAGLQPVGNTEFVPTRASGAATAARGATLKQASLESSNVDVATAMTDLMDAQRNFDMASRVIRMQDQLMEIANGIRR